MAGLVAYESSDEEEVAPAKESKLLQPAQETASESNQKPSTASEPDVKSQKSDEQQPIIGPQMGPTEGPSFPPLEEAPAEDEDPGMPPASPYSANRAMLRDLTLPTLPNMDIPPSPPGSPPPALNKKFEQFLELKKKGVHFNSKIAQSTALKNPALMDKLLNFAEIDQKSQYQTTLGTDIWDPAGFPRWAYKEQLQQSQTEISQSRARSKGGAVEFVPAAAESAQGAAAASHASLPHDTVHKHSTGKRKTRFDT
ncbi:HCNGP-like protein-domain-containing protein [Xylariaceae sp. FL0662B]|nr:HCNGP-like protein-domain-containing protein [Xylariaceae sp. FL0662B]